MSHRACIIINDKPADCAWSSNNGTVIDLALLGLTKQGVLQQSAPSCKLCLGVTVLTTCSCSPCDASTQTWLPAFWIFAADSLSNHFTSTSPRTYQKTLFISESLRQGLFIFCRLFLFLFFFYLPEKHNVLCMKSLVANFN